MHLPPSEAKSRVGEPQRGGCPPATRPGRDRSPGPKLGPSPLGREPCPAWGCCQAHADPLTVSLLLLQWAGLRRTTARPQGAGLSGSPQGSPTLASGQAPSLTPRSPPPPACCPALSHRRPSPPLTGPSRSSTVPGRDAAAPPQLPAAPAAHGGGGGGRAEPVGRISGRSSPPRSPHLRRGGELPPAAAADGDAVPGAPTPPRPAAPLRDSHFCFCPNREGAGSRDTTTPPPPSPARPGRWR